MKQIIPATNTDGHSHPEYDFPNETSWNIAVVLWGVVLLVIVAFIISYLH